MVSQKAGKSGNGWRCKKVWLWGEKSWTQTAGNKQVQDPFANKRDHICPLPPRPFPRQTFCHVTVGKAPVLIRRIKNGRIPFLQFQVAAIVFMLVLLSHCRGLLEHLNRIILVTRVLSFLLWHSLSVWGEKGLTESKFQLERTWKQHAKCSDNESAG